MHHQTEGYTEKKTKEKTQPSHKRVGGFSYPHQCSQGGRPNGSVTPQEEKLRCLIEIIKNANQLTPLTTAPEHCNRRFIHVTLKRLSPHLIGSG